MLGLVFESIEHVAVRTLPDPVLEQPTDAIVQVQLAGLCGSDLHPFFGREVGIEAGTVMGHEFVGTITAVGSEVRSLKTGDRVFAPFTSNCGSCFYCRSGLTSRCRAGQLFGWRQDNRGLHGGQAQVVRVPLADGTLMPVPAGISDETALLLGDNLSTGYYAAELAGIRSDGVYAVVGCGTVGLLAITAALRLGATKVFAVDPNPSRLQLASSLGAVGCESDAAAWAAISTATDGRGADGVLELVGLPAAQQLAYRLLRPGGVMSVIGCHCSPQFAFSPADAYDKNLTYRTGRCPARYYMSRLAPELVANPLDLSWCITHRFDIRDARQAYDTFAYRQDSCAKAILTFDA